MGVVGGHASGGPAAASAWHSAHSAPLSILVFASSLLLGLFLGRRTACKLSFFTERVP